ncbi:hypothetical protein [Deinococcus aquaedulcis]|uniref:hypothetical protein n=1 Tax=Deinococcus aquaedulcis TaxID=2840455 RepID=UPI001C828BCA|nr:hypothetical protein [Deinococcus aquaedulcis]
MYMRDRLHAWSALEATVTCQPSKYVNSQRSILPVTITFSTGEEADGLYGSQWQPLTFRFELDPQGRWCTPDDGILLLLQGKLQWCCQELGLTWSVRRDDLGNFHACIDDVTAEARTSAFQAMFDAYQQRLERLKPQPATPEPS